MNGFVKFIQVLGALIALLALLAAIAVLYPIPYLTEFVAVYVLGIPEVSTTVAIVLAVVAVIALIFLLYACFATSKKAWLKVDTEHGEVTIDHTVAEAAAKHAARSVDEVKHPQAEAKMGNHPGDTKLEVTVDVSQDAPVATIAKSVQERVEDAVGRKLGAKPGSVNVKVNQIDTRAVQAQAAQNGPRVR
ncbi:MULTISPECIES: alkaline shock response membrane anchor protein AmaP [Aerococcus]|uniref:Alkaline shock response membrane anchor protein AmaP n=1 Tax=Aerococcus sanguinicola TaxID=119206 RepID=A0A5N1GLU7_9LACT|nr:MULTISPECIES: alkaline shock response membrane anchor protein AmaP [Aerococcus]KAA9299710.1 alkaline shock response membrane anchor protein AmaP [Aerococcus sanguinicola]MDK6369910.1 alkaline shock response membrane anchor protein AmaP [Aerococcus sp. UMB9870]MDK6680616.1 alkaline shock response membrane anchor protein AmaP [Aerococcus sp. UMB8608]MDK6687343.1 alkaline shock response membrane anchor protein AmaP [Aerococcus sp. UMB8623]MDK6940566.1 alkaline shock response membrane anchor pr